MDTHLSVADRAVALAPACREAAGAYALSPSDQSWERMQQRRRAAVAELVAHAGGRREPVSAAYEALVDRIARRSDDFDAAEALRLVTEALAAIGWDGDLRSDAGDPGARADRGAPGCRRASTWRRRRGRAAAAGAS